MPASLTRHTPLLAALSLLLFLGVWQALALALHSNTLPSPAKVAAVFWQALASGELPFHLGATLLRLVSSFTIAMLLGCAIGGCFGRNRTLDAFAPVFAKVGFTEDSVTCEGKPLSAVRVVKAAQP